MRGCARAQGGVHAAGRGGKGGGAAVQRRPHVLVCAPSNGALDEIVIRVVRDGLTDGRGRGWKPRVVRVGVSVHHTLSHVSLEALVQAKMADHQVRKPPPPLSPLPPNQPRLSGRVQETVAQRVVLCRRTVLCAHERVSCWRPLLTWRPGVRSKSPGTATGSCEVVQKQLPVGLCCHLLLRVAATSQRTTRRGLHTPPDRDSSCPSGEQGELASTRGWPFCGRGSRRSYTKRARNGRWARAHGAGSGQGGEARGERGERERLQTEMLDGADVICSTLSFAGSGVFARMARPLDALVVDEAAQAVEPACLIPMALGITQARPPGAPALTICCSWCAGTRSRAGGGKGVGGGATTGFVIFQAHQQAVLHLVTACSERICMHAVRA